MTAEEKKEIARKFNAMSKAQQTAYLEKFNSPLALGLFQDLLEDWS